MVDGQTHATIYQREPGEYSVAHPRVDDPLQPVKDGLCLACERFDLTEYHFGCFRIRLPTSRLESTQQSFNSSSKGGVAEPGRSRSDCAQYYAGNGGMHAGQLDSQPKCRSHAYVQRDCSDADPAHTNDQSDKANRAPKRDPGYAMCIEQGDHDNGTNIVHHCKRKKCHTQLHGYPVA